jgi:multicomponent Na+:H+ antiporter subunit E
VLTWVPGRAELVVGVAISFFVAALFGDIFYVNYKNFFKLRHFVYFIYYIPVFAYYCIKANIDVAYRVLHPKLPISPGIVKIKTNLKRESSIVMLANSITLTPGTMTIDVIDGYMYIHWINVQAKDTKKATEIISSRFERIIKGAVE